MSNGNIYTKLNMLDHELRKTGKKFTTKVVQNKYYGTVILVTIHMNAKEAFKLWLKLIDLLHLSYSDTILIVRWTGKTDLSHDELIKYYATVLKKLNLRIKTLKAIDLDRE